MKIVALQLTLNCSNIWYTVSSTFYHHFPGIFLNRNVVKAKKCESKRPVTRCDVGVGLIGRFTTARLSFLENYITCNYLIISNQPFASEPNRRRNRAITLMMLVHPTTFSSSTSARFVNFVEPRRRNGHPCEGLEKSSTNAHCSIIILLFRVLRWNRSPSRSCMIASNHHNQSLDKELKDPLWRQRAEHTDSINIRKP